MRKVIVFGNIPLWAGGKQSSGASMVLWELAEHINRSQSEFEVEIIATDVSAKAIKSGHTRVQGWNYSVIARSLYEYSSVALPYINIALKLSRQYRVSFFGVYAKLVWFNSVVKKNRHAFYHLHGTDYFMILEYIFKRNKISSAKVIYTVHAIAGNDSLIPGYQAEQFKEYSIAAYRPFCISFVSSQLCNEWKSTYGTHTRTVVIPNAINDSYIACIKNNVLTLRKYEEPVKVLLTIGSISRRKGQMRVLEALNKTKNKASIVYQCIGHSEPENLEEMEAFAEQHQLQFEYLGVMEPPEVSRQLSRAHFMILPSSSEGFGLVYAESICTGTPVIIPKGLPFVTEKKLNACNSVLLDDHTSESILSVLDNIHSYRFESNAVAHSIEHISWDDVAKEYLSIYKEMYEKSR